MSYLIIPLNKFYVGNIRYVKQSAKLGRMGKVRIRECITSDLYKDYYNGLWNASELIPYDQAKQIAEDYLNSQIIH
jgi:hypothetical protein